MSKRKKPSLLDGIAAMDAVSNKRPAWFERFRATDPEAFGELMEVAKDFLAGGVSFQRLGSQATLWRCLASQKAIPKVSESSFINFMRWVDDNEEKTS